MDRYSDELTFKDGARITVTGKDIHGGDSAWWAGSLSASYVKPVPQDKIEMCVNDEHGF